jgi:hypothetical protein
VYDGSTLVGHTTVHADGTWSVAVTLTAVGHHSLTATQTVNLPPDAGVTSAPSCSVTVVVVPDVPVVGAVTQTGSSRSGAAAAVSGTGAAGDVITLYDNGRAIGSAVVGATGLWSDTVVLGSGIHALTAAQTVPGWPPSWQLTSGQGAAVAVIVTISGSTATLLPYTPPAAPTISSATQTTVAGTGVYGDTVVVYDNGTAIASATVGRSGTWSVRVSLCAGSHSLTAVQQVVSGAPSPASGAVVVTVYAPTPAPALWNAPQGVATGASFTVVGTGVAGDTITLYDGTKVIGTTTVAADGSWTMAVAFSTTGRHYLATAQTDPSSHLTSGSCGSQEVDAYALPSVAPISSVAAVRGPSSTFLVSGTGVAGETVTIYDGATPIGSAVVGWSGKWSLTVRLGSGTHSLSTTQTVGQYVTGPSSAAVSLSS